MVRFLDAALGVVVQRVRSDAMARTAGIVHSAVKMVVGQELVCHQLDFDIHIENWSDLANQGYKSGNTGGVAAVGILLGH